VTPFVRHRGIAAPLLRINVDTDQIIPSREMKTVGKRGLADGLFAGWRYRPGGREPDPDFVLNRPEYAGASILLSGANFGCGSSREHAVWALAEYGIRCIIAPSFGAIFHGNCVRNGLLPLVLDAARVQSLAAQVDADPQHSQLSIDLDACELTKPDGSTLPFAVEPAHRAMLLEGLDPIRLTLKHLALIEAHLARDRQRRPWVYR
jgi:3-isopropylmalate/(R)-2-methylmalate dehydratase small subunit